MKMLKQYAKLYKKVKAIEEVMKDMSGQCIRELKKYPDGQADFDGVEFHLTQRQEKIFAEEAQEEMKQLSKKIDLIKEDEIRADRVEYKVKELFDASIPRSVQRTIFGEVLEYRKYFN